MTVLNIEGQSVTVDSSFLKLSPDEQNKTVEEIAGSLKLAKQPEASFDKNDPRFSQSSMVGSKFLEGVPVLGAYVPKAGAALSALGHPLTGVGKPGESFSDRYSANLLDEQAASKAFETENPNLSTALKVGGGIAGTAPLIAAAPAAFGVGGASLLPSMAAGAISGGGLAAADAGARGEDAGRAAMFGAGGGAAGPLIGKAVGAVAGKLTDIAPKSPTTEELYSAATKGFDQVRNMDVRIKSEAIKTLASDVHKALVDDGLRDYLAPKTFAVIKELTNPPAGSVATFGDLHGMRRVLGQIAGSVDPTERMAASRTISALDEYLSSIPKSDVLSGDAAKAVEIFNEAKGNYAAAKRADVLQGKLDAADLQAATANSGANIDNAIRQRVKDILKSEKLRRGFSQDEILQMQRIARGTAPANVIRAIGNLLGGGGGLGALASGGAGFVAAGPAGAVAPVAGYAVKKLGNAMTASQAEKLSQMIRLRSPEGAKLALENQLAMETNAARRLQLQKLIMALADASAMNPAHGQAQTVVPLLPPIH